MFIPRIRSEHVFRRRHPFASARPRTVEEVVSGNMENTGIGVSTITLALDRRGRFAR